MPPGLFKLAPNVAVLGSILRKRVHW